MTTTTGMEKTEEYLRSAVKQKFLEFQRHKVVAEGFNSLRKLDPKLYYHSIQHTEDVVNEAILFGLRAGLSERKLELLVVAATFHDAGFLERQEENELAGARMAADAMDRARDYSPSEIAEVVKAIEETALVPDGGLGPGSQRPKTELGRFLCDADTSNLGRGDFLEKTTLFFREREAFGTHVEEKQFFGPSLIAFLEGHTWHTEAARELRQACKLRNLGELRGRI